MSMLAGAKLNLSIRIIGLGSSAVCCDLGRIGLWAVAFISDPIVETIKPGRLYCMMFVRSFPSIAWVSSRHRWRLYNIGSNCLTINP